MMIGRHSQGKPPPHDVAMKDAGGENGKGEGRHAEELNQARNDLHKARAVLTALAEQSNTRTG